MFKKVAITLGTIFLIGLIIILLRSTLQPTLAGIWDWVFLTMFQMTSAPPNPFN